jgi:tetratricopeptide (TPR) repeat protein/DNA-binding CsgD family transcriptional regulator
MPKATDLHALNEEAWAVKSSDRARSHELATEVLQLAEKERNRNEVLQAKLTLASGACFRMELELAANLLDEVETYLTDATPREVIARHKYQHCFLHWQKAEFQDVLSVGGEMLDFINGRGLHNERGWVLATMGMVHQRMGHSHLALNSYRESEALLQGTGDRAQLSNVKMCIGTALGELEKKAEAQTMFQEALNLRLAVGGDFHAGMIIGNMAKTYHQMGDHAKALLRWNEAVELLKKEGGMPFWAQAVAGRADTLRAMGRPKVAEAELKEAFNHADQIPPIVLINLHIALARVHVDSMRWEDALHSLRETEALITDATDHSLLFDLHALFHHVFKALGQTTEALEHHEKMFLHRDRHLNDLSLKRLAEWEALYDLQRTRDRKLLGQTKAMQEQLAEVTNERNALLHRVSKSDTLMGEMLGMIPAKSKGRVERLIRTAQKTEEGQSSDAVLEARIAAVHPAFSQAELRTCTMIVRGWSTKEMADHSGTSLKAIEKHRASIRRKTGLPRSVSLSVYLAGLAKLV